ncbi:MAG: ribosome assembly cofactor RimP [Bacteroidales bacterium]|nr:ribosome assembly cofactor RimP [Bacteroidales bacterium]
MIDKKKISDLLRAFFEESGRSDLFEVGVSVSPKNEIKVHIDGMQGVDIDTCAQVSRHIEAALDRDAEDFELTVSSAGLDQPLKVYRQYIKNTGREVKLTTRNGETLKGILESADEQGITLREEPTKKNPEPRVHTFSYEQIKETKIVISFK